MVLSGPVPRNLRLHASRVPISYGGRLYFIVGPGLGDTVNDFRIVHEIRPLFPNAKCVVYADARWKDLCKELPDLKDVTMRFHEEAPSPMSDARAAVKPYYQTFEAIIQEIVAEGGHSPGFVVLGGFKCADQLAKKEPNLAMKARAIGLSLRPEQCRPFLPLTRASLEESERFLKERTITPKNYVVIAPYTTADKMWELEAWESLITLLHQSTGLPVLIIGDQGGASFRKVWVHEAIGLPITLIAGLIAQSRCFIGLDSGTTHLAACFDVPIVTLNPQGKFPPFLVEAQSPYRWTHLTPGLYGNRPIKTESVLEVVQKTLSCLTPAPCPLCSGLPYILGAKKGRVLYLCRCGLIYRDPQKSNAESPPQPAFGREVVLPTRCTALSSLFTSLAMENGANRTLLDNGSIALTFEHWSPRELDPVNLLAEAEARDLWWSWDAAYAFLNQGGWRIVESRVHAATANSGAVFSVKVKAAPKSSTDPDVYLRVPWGRKSLKIRRSLYDRWLSWESFQKLDELEGLGWHLANEGMVQDGGEILRLALTLGHRPRTLERLFRVACRSVWHKLVESG